MTGFEKRNRKEVIQITHHRCLFAAPGLVCVGLRWSRCVSFGVPPEKIFSADRSAEFVFSVLWPAVHTHVPTSDHINEAERQLRPFLFSVGMSVRKGLPCKAGLWSCFSHLWNHTYCYGSIQIHHPCSCVFFPSAQPKCLCSCLATTNLHPQVAVWQTTQDTASHVDVRLSLSTCRCMPVCTAGGAMVVACWLVQIPHDLSALSARSDLILQGPTALSAHFQALQLSLHALLL